MRQFCSETAGKGKENKDARKQCMRRMRGRECEEECTSEPGLLLEESDEGDDEDLDEDGEAEGSTLGGAAEDGEAEDGEDERAVSGGGSRKACRTCKKALTKDKKKEMRNFCREIAGKGKENKDARKECMRESFREECKEECTFQAPNKACRTCKKALTKDKKKDMRQSCK